MNTLNPIQYADASGYSAWYEYFIIEADIEWRFNCTTHEAAPNDRSLLTIFPNTQNFISYKAIFINNKKHISRN